jgi:hypothetical protein
MKFIDERVCALNIKIDIFSIHKVEEKDGSFTEKEEFQGTFFSLVEKYDFFSDEISFTIRKHPRMMGFKSLRVKMKEIPFTSYKIFTTEKSYLKILCRR